MAAHDAVIVFGKPTELIQAADLDLVVELQKLHTTPNELTIKWKSRNMALPRARRAPVALKDPEMTALFMNP